MHVDINHGWIDLQEDHEDWLKGWLREAAIRLTHRVHQRPIDDRTTVDKDALRATHSAHCCGTADRPHDCCAKSIIIDCFADHGQWLSPERLTEHIPYASDRIGSCFKVEDFARRTLEAKCDRRVRECGIAHDFSHARCLCRVTSKKVTARRNVGKKPAHFDASAHPSSGWLGRFDRTKSRLDRPCLGLTRRARTQREMRNRSDRAESFPPKSKREYPIEIVACGNLAGRVRRKRESQFIARNPTPIVAHCQQFASPRLDSDRNLRRPSVERILDEFFRDTCRSFDHLACSDLVHKRCWKKSNGHRATYPTRMRDTVVIGDVHGCGEELAKMFQRLTRLGRDCRIILIGDLLTKGPRPDLVVEEILAQERSGRRIELVCGNHEERALMALRRAGAHGEAKGLPPRLAEMVDILADADLLSEATELMERAMQTPYLRGRNPLWTAVHAGVDPLLGFARTPQRQRMTMKAAPNESDWWWSYDGKDGLMVVGHKPLSRPLILRRPDGRAVVAAIDTGCVYGGFLTAYRVGSDRLFMIKSAQRRLFNFRRRTSRRPADSAWRAASAVPVRKLVR